MLERALLREQFSALLTQERDAARAYEELVKKVSDSSLRSEVQQLLKDKQRHIQLTERLLEIVD